MFDWNELQKLLPTREDLFLLIDEIFHDEIINKGLGLLLHQACDLIFQEDFKLLFNISTEVGYFLIIRKIDLYNFFFIDYRFYLGNFKHWSLEKCKAFFL